VKLLSACGEGVMSKEVFCAALPPVFRVLTQKSGRDRAGGGIKSLSPWTQRWGIDSTNIKIFLIMWIHLQNETVASPYLFGSLCPGLLSGQNTEHRTHLLRRSSCDTMCEKEWLEMQRE